MITNALRAARTATALRGALPAALLAAFLAAGCADDLPVDPTDPGGDELVLRATEIAAGFDRPVQLVASPADDRLFVVEQGGLIRVILDGSVQATPYLDLRAHVSDGGERGLLAMAFHPQHPANGFVFVSYTGSGGATRIERYRTHDDGTSLDAGSALLVLEVEQPGTNHNGGMIAFAPDGTLWIGLGDGGGSGDPFANGQDASTLLGSMLRIDVDAAEPYGIPPDNPFADGVDGRPEIWAIGLRNPWRWSFDVESGNVFIADVGQGRREEINVQPIDAPARNYGWNRMEGTLCFSPPSGCAATGLVLPVQEYETGSFGCAVTGGMVYRGDAIPELRGHYLYADFCQGWVRSFRHVNGTAEDVRDRALGSHGRISSFGMDAQGELYFVTHDTGRVLRIEQDG